jgi:hypothetical protein
MENPQSKTLLLYAGALVVAPLLLLGARLTDITPDADTTAELLTLIEDRPEAWAAGQWFYFLTGLAWIPAGLALMHLFHGASRLGYWGAAALTVGGATVLPVDAAGLYLRELATSPVALETQVEIVEGVEGSAAVIAFETVHVLGLFGGLLVVGVALLRGRTRVPRWSGALVVAALVGLMAAPHPLLDIASVGCLLAGLGVAASKLVRASSSEPRPTGPDTSQLKRETTPTRRI